LVGIRDSFHTPFYIATSLVKTVANVFALCVSATELDPWPITWCK